MLSFLLFSFAIFYTLRINIFAYTLHIYSINDSEFGYIFLNISPTQKRDQRNLHIQIYIKISRIHIPHVCEF